MYANKYEGMGRINNNFWRSELNEYKVNSELTGVMSKQRSTDMLFAADHKSGVVSMKSPKGAAASGTMSPTQGSAANKPLHFNQPRSSLK